MMRIRTQRALARRNEELQVLSDIASTINASRDPDEILGTQVILLPRSLSKAVLSTPK